jgi:C-terminal processing protease CtpA/Prc
LFNTEYFNPETIDKIKYILDNAVVSSSHYVNVDLKQFGQIFITNESFYSEMLYPELPYRLLALFRYWNIVNYFFPYKELCDQKWSTVLADMLPEFVDARNQEEYISTCMKLGTKIDDSHGFFSPDLKRGLLKAPFEVRFIEDRLVVTIFTGTDVSIKEKIKIGDVITSINGEPVEDIVKRMLPYTPASNYPTKLREISSKILTGNSTTGTVVILRDGKSFEIKIPYYDFRLLNTPDYFNPQPDKKGFRILENNIGYVLPSSCKAEDLQNGTEKVLNGTKGVIIDFRCYPSSSVTSSFLPYLNLLEKDRFFAEMISNARVTYPGYFFEQKLIGSAIIPQKNYTQKIVVIVNEYTQSQAEEAVMYFQTASNVTVIGSTTAGADGRIVNFNLPGNIRVTMTGIGVYYPDGGKTQRVGIRIDEIVKPTIAGIKAGRDELLERAIKIINENNFN